MLTWLVLSLLGAGLWTIARRSSETVATLNPHVVGVPPPPPETAPESFVGVVQGQFYRVFASIPHGFGEAETFDDLQAEMRQTLNQIGFSDIRLATADPTDDHVWRFLARWARPEARGRNLFPLAIYKVERVEEPPVPFVVPPPPPTLDKGLTFEEAHAVDVAIQHETDPAKLHAFAAAMAVDFPIAQSFLEAKARILEQPATSATERALAVVSAGSQAVLNVRTPAPLATAVASAAREAALANPFRLPS
jgi:hypothetical protein